MLDDEDLPPVHPEEGFTYWVPRWMVTGGVRCADLGEWTRQAYVSQEVLKDYNSLTKQSALGTPGWAWTIIGLDEWWWEGEDYFSRHVALWLASPIRDWKERQFYRRIA